MAKFTRFPLILVSGFVDERVPVSKLIQEKADKVRAQLGILEFSAGLDVRFQDATPLMFAKLSFPLIQLLDEDGDHIRVQLAITALDVKLKGVHAFKRGELFFARSPKDLHLHLALGYAVIELLPNSFVLLLNHFN